MRYLILMLLCISFYSAAIAQTAKIKITENTVVKDSDGTVYPYSIWSILIRKPDYELHPVDKQNEQTDFVLVKLTEEQKNQRLEKMPKPRESEYFKTGKQFNFFKITDINDHKIDLKAEKGKIVVINFWFINCPPCRMEIPDLNELVDLYKGNDSIRFIGIALDGRYDLKQFLKTFPFNYNIVDDGRYLADRFGIRSFPTHVIIDQQGKVYFHTTGLAMNTAYWLKKSIAELLNQSAVVAKQ